MKLCFHPLVWLRRIRHRRGYGVHSPFAFQFITGVVYERTPFYAYDRLSRLHPWPERLLDFYSLRCHRLLFRIANYQHPSAITVIAATHHETDYMQAAVPSALIVERGASPLTFIGHEALPSALAVSHAMPADGLLILEGIHHDEASLRLWHNLQADPHTGITFDLYTYGICFFDPHLHKQHYIVNF